MKALFTKRKLQSGDYVIRRNGSIEIYSKELKTLSGVDGMIYSDNEIKEDLTCLYGEEFDIVRVCRMPGNHAVYERIDKNNDIKKKSFAKNRKVL